MIWAIPRLLPSAHRGYGSCQLLIKCSLGEKNDARIAPFVLDCFGSFAQKSMQFLDSIVEESALDACPDATMTKSRFLTEFRCDVHCAIGCN